MFDAGGAGVEEDGVKPEEEAQPGMAVPRDDHELGGAERGA